MYQYGYISLTSRIWRFQRPHPDPSEQPDRIGWTQIQIWRFHWKSTCLLLFFFDMNATFNKDTIIYDSSFHREVLHKFISVIVLMSTSVTLWKLSARRVWQRARPKKRHRTPPAHHCLVASGNWHSQICRFSLYRQVLQTLRGWKILLHPAGAVQ